MLQRILRRPAVRATTGLSTTTIYERMKLGTFPRAVTLGPMSVGWLEQDILAWQRARIAERDARGPVMNNDIPIPADDGWITGPTKKWPASATKRTRKPKK